jgi:soluble lytic murein transglycosylase-like protein
VSLSAAMHARRCAVMDRPALEVGQSTRYEAAMTRRNIGLAAVATCGLLLYSGQAQAGGQLEEPLVDSVRTALSNAVNNHAPPIPEFSDTESRLVYLRWLGATSEKLRRRKTDWTERKEFLQTIWYESKRAGLDVPLVLGLVQVESNFRKFAVSPVGARGYMQVMPFWTRVLAAEEGGRGDASKLFHMQTNLRFGCVILRHYLDREKGDLFMALGRYNGSRGKPQYPNAVLAAKKNWDYTPPR